MREVDRRLVRIGLLAVIGLDPVGVALLPAELALRELLVELARVEEHETRQLGCAVGEVDGSAEALPNQHGQQPAVVEVGVRDEHRVER